MQTNFQCVPIYAGDWLYIYNVLCILYTNYLEKLYDLDVHTFSLSLISFFLFDKFDSNYCIFLLK